MIYRKWSLLTGPTTILAGIVGTVAAINFVVFDNDPFRTREKKNSDSISGNAATK